MLNLVLIATKKIVHGFVKLVSPSYTKHCQVNAEFEWSF